MLALAAVVGVVWFVVGGKNLFPQQNSGSEPQRSATSALAATIRPTALRLSSTPQHKAATPLSGAAEPGGNLLSTMTRVRKNIQALAQDYEVEVHCKRNDPDSVLSNYEAVVNAPKFNATSATQAAYNDYRTAVDIIARTNKDLYLHCTAWVNGAATSNTVPRQTWGTARQGVNEALQAIEAGIAKLK